MLWSIGLIGIEILAHLLNLAFINLYFLTIVFRKYLILKTNPFSFVCTIYKNFLNRSLLGAYFIQNLSVSISNTSRVSICMPVTPFYFLY